MRNKVLTVSSKVQRASMTEKTKEMTVHSLKNTFWLIVICVAITNLAGCEQKQTTQKPIWQASDVETRPYGEVAIWADAIDAFVQADKTNPPPADSILFIGSSSIVFWKTLHEDMAPLSVIQRGFGGSKIYHSVYYADKIVHPYKPKAIVMFSGTNDIVTPYPGAPERVEQGFIDFVVETRAVLPDVDIHFISMSPTQARWAAYEQLSQANAKIEAMAKLDDKLYYIDTASYTMKDGKPNAALFSADKLHLNEDGYAVWTSIIKPHLIAQYSD